MQELEDTSRPKVLSGALSDGGTTQELEGGSLASLPTMSPQAAAHYLAEQLPRTPRTPAFARFPPAVISRLLWLVDANSFASLSVMSRSWYETAQDPELYAHHLSRCPSFALGNSVISGPFRRTDLAKLKRKFAAEVSRNLFDAYMTPRMTSVNLISVTTSSSAAFPGGEAFRFAFSPNGQTVLALSSSRIYVVDIASDPIIVTKQLKTMRKPLAASITDNGKLLAVLSSRYQANVYELSPAGVIHLQVLVMENPARTIALAHEGTVLAAAYETGIEVFSLAANALSTDRRAVRSEPVDTLSFSGDSSMLVGSSQSLEEPNAVVITAPFYTENDPDMSAQAIHSRMWTTQILFPQISSIASHAEILQNHIEGDANWLFSYDHTLMSYRAVRTDDTRSGVAYFLNPPTTRRYSNAIPSIPPTASACGTLVAAGFAGAGLWLYGVPERLDISPDMGAVVERHEQEMRGPISLTSATGSMEPLLAYSPSLSGSSYDIEDDSIAAKVDWRQSIFVSCKSIRSMDGFTGAKWVEHLEPRRGNFPDKRLVVVAPGGVDGVDQDMGDENVPVDGSRICLLDFDYGPSKAPDREVTIRVGDTDPDLLPEKKDSMEVEVALERRRTVRDSNRTPGRGVQSSALNRAATAASPMHYTSFDQAFRSPSVLSPVSPSNGHEQALDDSVSVNRDAVSPAILHRASTAAAYTTARYPPRPPIGAVMAAPWSPAQERWETPPPPYARPMQPESPAVIPPSPAGVSQQTTSQAQPRNNPLPDESAPSISVSLPTVNSDQPKPVDSIQPLQHRSTEPVKSTQVIMHPPARAGTTPMTTITIQSTETRVIDNTRSGTRAVRPNPAHPTPLASVVEDRRLNISGRSSPVPALQTQGIRSGTPHQTPTSEVSRTPVQDNRDSLALGPTISHPLSPPHHPLSPLTPVRETIPPALAPVPDPHNHQQQQQLTLTGANLRNRLNQPVPPTPEGFTNYNNPSTISQPWMSNVQPQAFSQSQIGNRNQVSQVGPVNNTQSGVFEFTGPTPDQIAGLNRRLSQTGQRPGSAGMKGEYPASSQTINNVQGPNQVTATPSPSRAARGGSGMPGSTTFTKMQSSHMISSTGLHRSGSQASNRSLGGSSSTPNLHAFSQNQHPRPNYDRLDTVESVPGARSGGFGHAMSSSYRPMAGQPLQRPHSMVPDVATYAAQSAALAGYQQSASGYSPVGPHPIAVHPSPNRPQTPQSSAPSVFGEKRRRSKWKRTASEPLQNHPQANASGPQDLRPGTQMRGQAIPPPQRHQQQYPPQQYQQQYYQHGSAQGSPQSHVPPPHQYYQQHPQQLQQIPSGQSQQQYQHQHQQQQQQQQKTPQQAKKSKCVVM